VNLVFQTAMYACVCQVAGDTEVKAQIRLQFRDITGQKCMAIRSLVASQKVMSIIEQIICCVEQFSLMFNHSFYHAVLSLRTWLRTWPPKLSDFQEFEEHSFNKIK